MIIIKKKHVEFIISKFNQIFQAFSEIERQQVEPSIDLYVQQVFPIAFRPTQT